MFCTFIMSQGTMRGVVKAARLPPTWTSPYCLDPVTKSESEDGLLLDFGIMFDICVICLSSLMTVFTMVVFWRFCRKSVWSKSIKSVFQNFPELFSSKTIQWSNISENRHSLPSICWYDHYLMDYSVFLTPWMNTIHRDVAIILWLHQVVCTFTSSFQIAEKLEDLIFCMSNTLPCYR